MMISTGVVLGSCVSLDSTFPLRWTPVVGVVTATGYAMFCWSLERTYYARPRGEAPLWKVQPDRWTRPALLREARILSVFNAFCGGTVGTMLVLCVPNRLHRRSCTMLFDMMLFYLYVELYAYVVHRCLHYPALYALTHKIHHRHVAPSPFSAYAMHPAEFMLFVVGPLLIIYIVPLHVGAVISVLGFMGYHAVLDHSGIHFDGDLFPWQPPTRYHDRHHQKCTCNFGQSLELLDKVFGTYDAEFKEQKFKEQKFKEQKFKELGAASPPL